MGDTVRSGGTGNGENRESGSKSFYESVRTLWIPWTSIDPESPDPADLWEEGEFIIDDLHLHRFCRVLPTAGPEPGDRPSDFRFLDGPIRWGLRHTPLVILSVMLLLIGYAELSPDLQGISAFLPAMSPIHGVLLAGGAVLWAILLGMLGAAGLFDAGDLLKAIVVYAIGIALAAGTLLSIVLVLTAEDPGELPPNVIFLSGYLLMLFVGGHLVYEGMLRTETLFWHLGERDIVANRTGYHAFRSELADRLSASIGPVPLALAFGVLFVLQFGAVWAIGDGPQNLGSPATLLLNVVLDVAIVVVAFQFLVLIKYFHELVSDAYESDEHGPVELRYEPFHVDGHAGFRDLGRFATRVNLLLIMAGLYLVYRLYVQGIRVLPTEGLLAVSDGATLALWSVNYVAPVLAYGVAAGAWLYYSFWAIHRKMVRDREQLTLEHQGRRVGTVDRLPSVGDPIDQFDDGPDWLYLKEAPVWPINTRQMAGLVSGNVIPLLLPLSNTFL